MNLLKAVVLCLALLLAAEAAADVQVAKLSTSKGSFRSDNDADTSKSSEERALPSGLSSAIKKAHSFRASYLKWYRDYTATALFRIWKLGDNVSDLFKNPKLLEWVNIVEKQDPMDKNRWIRILMSKTWLFTLNDAIYKAMRSPDEKIRLFAKELQLGRLEIWTEEGVPLKEVLGKLCLLDDEFFGHPAFQQWYKYCKRQPNYDNHAFFVALLQRYTADHVIKVFFDGKSNPSTTDLATDLYEDLLTYYRNVEQTSNDLLKRLFDYNFPNSLLDTSSSKYHLWKDIALKDTKEEEHEKLYKGLKAVWKDSHTLQYILMLKKTESADLAHQLETLFVSDSSTKSEKEFKKITHWMRQSLFKNYQQVLTNKREEYVKSSRESTSKN